MAGGIWAAQAGEAYIRTDKLSTDKPDKETCSLQLHSRVQTVPESCCFGHLNFGPEGALCIFQQLMALASQLLLRGSGNSILPIKLLIVLDERN
jgi:hypothetical protein